MCPYRTWIHSLPAKINRDITPKNKKIIELGLTFMGPDLVYNFKWFLYGKLKLFSRNKNAWCTDVKKE